MATNNQTIPPSGADPGFPVGVGANLHAGTLAATYNFVKYSQKLHEIKKILGRRGWRASGAPPPPLF